MFFGKEVAVLTAKVAAFGNVDRPYGIIRHAKSQHARQPA
jgi:hypothetical protein